MSLYQPDIFKSLWLESDHLLPSDTAQFKGSPTSTGFALTEHYSGLTMMKQRNKKSLQWKQQRGMAVKEVQTLWHQRCTSRWQTQSTSSLCLQFWACPRVTSTCATRYWQEAAPPQPSCTIYSCGPSQASVYPCSGSDLPSIFQQICETNPTAKSNPSLLVSRHSQIHQFCFLLNVTIEGERGEGEREGIMTCSCFCFGWFSPSSSREK